MLRAMPVIEALVDALSTQWRVGRQTAASDLPRASTCPGWSVRDVENHSIGVSLKSADFASAKTDHPRPPPGDLIGSNLFDALAHTCDIATPANVAIECSDVLWSAGLVAAHAVIDP